MTTTLKQIKHLINQLKVEVKGHIERILELNTGDGNELEIKKLNKIIKLKEKVIRDTQKTKFTYKV